MLATMAKVLLGPITLGLRGTREDADVDMRGEYSHPSIGANGILACIGCQSTPFTAGSRPIRSVKLTTARIAKNIHADS